jgi:outer membrane protein assembly factor BamB
MILLALALAAHTSVLEARLPRAPADVWSVRWSRSLVPPEALEWKAREPGGPAIDPGGPPDAKAEDAIVVVGTRDGVLRASEGTGRARWAFRADGGFPAPPLVASGVVYVGSSDGRLYALDVATGKERWRYVAGEEVGTTPVLANGVVYVATLQDAIIAVDAATGAWKWHHRRESTRSSTAFTIRGAAGPAVEAGVLYGAFSDGTVVALDAASGAPRWQRKVGPEGQFNDVDSTPIVREGRVYVAAYSGAVVALDAANGYRLVAAGDVLVAVTATQVIGLSRADGQVLWALPLGGEPAGNPIAAGDRVFVPTVRSLAVLDARTGKRLVTFDPGTGVSASPALRDRRMYVLSNGGTLVAVDLR